MRKCKLHITAALAMAVTFTLPAANHFVRPGATGSNNGSDWTNAWSTIPAVLVRGDTYYLADGSYSALTLDDPESGSLPINIKKATVGDHGTHTGWQDSYGDGQAVVPSLSVTTSYWIIDGQRRTSESAGHGICFQTPTSGTPLRIGPGANYLTFRYVEISNAGAPPANGPDLVDANDGVVHDLAFSYCLFKNSGRTCLYTQGAYAILIEHTLFDTCYPHPVDYHGEFLQLRSVSDFTIRWCRFTNHGSLSGIGLTGVICSMSGGMTGGYIYGNIFDRVGNPVYQDNSGTLSNIYFYNNTSYGSRASVVKTGLGGATNIVYRNNVIYNDPDNYVSWTTEDHNYHSYSWFTYAKVLDDATDAPVYTHALGPASVITEDPFVNSAVEDFRLAGELTGFDGIEIANVGAHRFDLDYDGNIRGAGGVWDRGAYEYNGGGNTINPPSGLRLKD